MLAAEGHLTSEGGEETPKAKISTGIIRWAFGHARVNPGSDLIDFRSRQERAVQRHLAKRTNATR
jgi:hypothetical protein